ncbi:L-amino acid N-acyltransferase YncA [Maribacter spongiicola]|uniref:L-amino acid N-acyltransferase YncA n=1 Tax=Maribacter spongiicola TaxID=1206753 RepID=A0A4R7K6A8_9FLAO|nr:GNAT family N-acetyltransferase [Maribacter spongiicola]TDT46796.1 L-amino acid N-acyltransferase YncA [Maribacter spongiicola]
MRLREATKADVEKIAKLHSVSWQQNYRASFSAEFLDNLAFDNRLNEWKNRFQNPSLNQYVLIAEEDGNFLGFMCAYFNYDDQYGTLLDNLHVALNTQGKGIGTKLMAALAKEIVQRDSTNDFYLWVLNTNIAAIKYYEKIGGVAKETVESNDIGDKTFLKIRYYWEDASLFLENTKAKIHNT